MIRILLWLVLSLFTLVSCTISKVSSGHPKAVPYIIGANYYNATDNKQAVTLVITTQEQMDNYLREAAVMGHNGEPTKVDFNKNFVIARLLSETNRATTITPISLSDIGCSTLLFTYKETMGKEQRSYTIKPFCFIVVDKKYITCKLQEKRL